MCVRCNSAVRRLLESSPSVPLQAPHEPLVRSGSQKPSLRSTHGAPPCHSTTCVSLKFGKIDSCSSPFLFLILFFSLCFWNVLQCSLLFVIISVPLSPPCFPVLFHSPPLSLPCSFSFPFLFSFSLPVSPSPSPSLVFSASPSAFPSVFHSAFPSASPSASPYASPSPPLSPPPSACSCPPSSCSFFPFFFTSVSRVLRGSIRKGSMWQRTRRHATRRSGVERCQRFLRVTPEAGPEQSGIIARTSGRRQPANG